MGREKGYYCHDLQKNSASGYGKMTVKLDPQEKYMTLGRRPRCPYRHFRIEGTAVNYFQMLGFAGNKQTEDGDSDSRCWHLQNTSRLMCVVGFPITKNKAERQGKQ